MRFLEVNEAWSWCEGCGIALTAARRPIRDESRPWVWREVFPDGLPPVDAPLVAQRMIDEIGPWDVCLLWAVRWDVWSTTEDWPLYYAARGRFGEKRSLETAPGFLASREHLNTLLEFVGYTMIFGWDAHVLPVLGGQPTARRGFVSHDGWAEVRDYVGSANR